MKVEDPSTKKNIGDFRTLRSKILCFEQRIIIEKHDKTNIGRCWKGPKKLAYKAMRGIKKKIMNARNINV